jgi:hypothetical protein
MGVSVRYILAAAAVALAPSAAFADCAGCNGGSVLPSNPAVNVPGPVIGNPNFTGGPVPGGPREGCGQTCNGGLPSGPTIVVPQPFVPAPNVVITNGGVAPPGASSINVTQYVDNTHFDIRSSAYAYAGASAFGVDGGAGMVMGAAAAATRAHTETRVTEQVVAIQAICIDDRGNPHPASQTFGEQEIDGAYDGEIFRCIAGTQMRVTIGRAQNSQISFENGRVFDCARGEALVYRNGTVLCRTQEVRRQCNERSLLRRFGPGIKLVRIRIEEQVTTHQEVRHERQVEAPVQMFDGGVGGGVW